MRGTEFRNIKQSANRVPWDRKERRRLCMELTTSPSNVTKSDARPCAQHYAESIRNIVSMTMGEQILKSTFGMWEIMKLWKYEWSERVHWSFAWTQKPEALMQCAKCQSSGPWQVGTSLHVAFALSIGQTLLLPMSEFGSASSFSALFFMYSIIGSPIYFKREKVEERLQVSYLFTLTLCLNG